MYSKQKVKVCPILVALDKNGSEVS